MVQRNEEVLQNDIGPKELTQTGAVLLDNAKAHTMVAWCANLLSRVFIRSMCCKVLTDEGEGSASHRIIIAV
jgi:hypothetical protein